MSIKIADTPNPNTIKMFLGRIVLYDEAIFYACKKEAVDSPFVTCLFDVEGVKTILLGEDYISVTRFEEYEWELLKDNIVGAITSFFHSNQPIFRTKEPENKEEPASVDDAIDLSDPIVQQINDLIESRVKPAVMQDGGKVVFRSFKDGIVYLELQGACSGCPSAAITLKDGIKNILQFYVEEVQDVE